MKKLNIAILMILLVILAWIIFRFVWISSFQRGSKYMKNGKYDQAILCFDKTIKLNPKFAPSYCNRGTCYYEKDEYEKAVVDFTTALELNPKFVEAYFNRAAAYCQLQEYDRAWEDVHKAESMDFYVPPDFLKVLRAASGKKE